MPQKCPRFVPPENMEHHNFVSYVHRDCCVCQKKGLGGSIRDISKHRHRRNVMSYRFKSLFKLFSLSFYCFHLSDCFKFFDYFHFCDYYDFFDYSCITRCHHLHYLEIWQPGGTTCISYKFGQQVTPHALVKSLANRWRHLYLFYMSANLSATSNIITNRQSPKSRQPSLQ